MSDQSAIEWCDATWNCLRGCSRVSEGCRHCYAERTAIRFRDGTYQGLVRSGPNGEPRWTGEVRLVEEKLTEPLRWKKPRRIFVNSMSDLFHEKVPDEWIDRIFAVMALAPQHTFIVLTKRPERMRQYMTDQSTHRADSRGRTLEQLGGGHLMEGSFPWPLPNVHLGVSVENQETADQRIPLLLQTPAAVRIVSYEPALGPVNFWAIKDGSWYDREGAHLYNALRGTAYYSDGEHGLGGGPKLDQVIIGGESGPRARPCDVNWLREVVSVCAEAGVPCFVKQLGAQPRNWCRARLEDPEGERANLYPEDYCDAEEAGEGCASCPGRCFQLLSSKGGDMDEWPADLRVRQFPHEVR